MIFVEELDIYLRCFYYWINFDSYASIFSMTQDLKSWKLFFDRHQPIFKQIENAADNFGFVHNFAAAKGMFGEKEIVTRRMNYLMSFDGLKIYPRLLYSEGYIPKPKDFDIHRYYFTYLPIVLGLVYQSKEGKSLPLLSMQGTTGSYFKVKETGEHRIAYNVSTPINLETIIEEELHSHGQEVHGTTSVKDVLQKINSNDPNLQKEIELNLNNILSAEEQKFRSFGDLMTREKTPELNRMKVFNDLFEKFLIEHAPIV